MAYPYPAPDPTAVVGRRILAYGIDLTILVGILVAVVVPAFFDLADELPATRYKCEAVSGIEPQTEFSDRNRTEVGGAGQACLEAGDTVYLLGSSETSELNNKFWGIVIVVGGLNLVLLQGLTGASIGKLLTNLRVIRKDGKIANVGWAAIRWVLLLVDACLCFLPGLITMLATKGHRRVGDMAASTFVVAKASVGTPPQVPGVTVAADYVPPGGAAPGWPTPPPPTGATWGPPPGSDPTAVAPAPAAQPGGDGPIWDEARNTYIQYDRAVEAWVQWDTDSSQWRPIDQ